MYGFFGESMLKLTLPQSKIEVVVERCALERLRLPFCPVLKLYFPTGRERDAGQGPNHVLARPDVRI